MAILALSVGWPQEHVVKCLVFLIHSMGSVRLEQEALIDEVLHPRLLPIWSRSAAGSRRLLPRDRARPKMSNTIPPDCGTFLSTGDPAGLVETAAVKPRSLWREISQHIEHYDLNVAVY